MNQDDMLSALMAGSGAVYAAHMLYRSLPWHVRAKLAVLKWLHILREPAPNERTLEEWLDERRIDDRKSGR